MTKIEPLKASVTLSGKGPKPAPETFTLEMTRHQLTDLYFMLNMMEGTYNTPEDEYMRDKIGQCRHLLDTAKFNHPE